MGRSPACSSNYKAEKDGAAAGSLKKGAWTPEEDQKLVSFIEKNKGHGSWRTLPHLAGLQRCGKSCRLRWTNYLRPNIKRGNFSVEEERTITQLHALLGNKWSSIASHLPGRTDNEVKNHWNTHMKKRLTRMGIDPATHRPSAAVDHSNLMQALMNIRPNYNIQLQPLLVNGDSSLTLNAAPPRCTTVIPDPADIISTNSHAHPHAALRRPAAGPKPATSVACPNFSITPLPVDTSFVTHMAQWELARLEAEARLAATSTSSSASARRPRSTELSHLMKSSGRSSCASGTNFPSWRNFGSSGALAPNDKSEKSSSSSSSAIACKRYMVKPPPPDNQIILQALTEMLSVSVLSMPGNDSTEESASILSLPSLGASSTSCASASSKSKQSTNGAADDDHNSTDNDNIALQNMMSSGVNITDPAAGSGGAAIKDVVLERSSWSSSIRSGCTADDAENSTPNNLQRSGCKTITSDSLQNLMMLDVDDDQPLDVDLMIISPEPATSCHHISMDQMVIRAQAPAVPLFDLMNVNNIDPAGASPDQPCESSGSPAAYWAHLLNGLVLGPSSSTLSSCS